MENTHGKNGAPLQTTTSKKEAISERIYDLKNVSSETKPFQYPEARGQPCMSILWPISDAVLRTPESCKTPAPAARVHKMSDEDREFFDSALVQLRADCRKMLEFLVKFDSGISHMDAQSLCDAINAIDRAVIVA